MGTNECVCPRCKEKMEEPPYDPHASMTSQGYRTCPGCRLSSHFTMFSDPDTVNAEFAKYERELREAVQRGEEAKRRLAAMPTE